MVTYKEASELIKTLLSVAGIILSIVGIAASVLAYFLISPIITDAENAVIKQVDSATLILDSAEGMAANLSAAVEPFPSVFTSTGDSLVEMSGTLSATAAAFDELSTQVPTGQRQPLVTAANGLKRSAASLNLTGASYKEISGTVKAASDALKAERADISKSKRDIQKIKGDVRKVFGTLNNGLLILTALFILIFLGTLSLSIVSAL